MAVNTYEIPFTPQKGKKVPLELREARRKGRVKTLYVYQFARVLLQDYYKMTKRTAALNF